MNNWTTTTNNGRADNVGNIPAYRQSQGTPDNSEAGSSMKNWTKNNGRANNVSNVPAYRQSLGTEDSSEAGSSMNNWTTTTNNGRADNVSNIPAYLQSQGTEGNADDQWRKSFTSGLGYVSNLQENKRSSGMGNHVDGQDSNGLTTWTSVTAELVSQGTTVCGSIGNAYSALNFQNDC